jgi:hypothetical protein
MAVGLVVVSPGASAAEPPAPPLGPVEVPTDHAVDVVLPDGVAVTLEPGTRAHWHPRTRLPTETNHFTQGYHLVLIEGEIEVRMPPGPRGSHAFLVATAQGTLTDWRGKLHVRVHAETAAAAIYQGALVVGSNGVGFPVYDGAGVLMRKGIDPDKSRPIPAAPQWESERASPAISVVPSGTPAQVKFAWQRVQGAATYRAMIASDPSMSHVIEVASTPETSFTMLEREPAGRYWVQVRAVGPEGIASEWSAPRPLRVVHYTVPDGGMVARDGALVLRAREQVALTGAEGLEVSYTTAGTPAYWGKLSGALSFPPGDDPSDRVAHLRDPAIPGEATLRLAHRQLRADIELSPRAAHAGDPIEVRALIWDPSGRVDAANETVKLQALLDIDPVEVAWQRMGNQWTGRVNSRPMDTPTIVRVTATDDRGTEIGRGFLELESTSLSRR